MTKFFRYSSYVLRHKFFVFLECLKYGLVWRGLMHDLSKLRPSEFVPYMHHFGAGIQTGRDKTGYYKAGETDDLAFDFAWLRHQNRNDHHWQYWVVPLAPGQVRVMEMSENARREMIADWRGAGRAQGTPNTLAWYTANKNKMLFGPQTRAWVEREIGYRPPDWCGCGSALYGGPCMHQPERFAHEFVNAMTKEHA